MFKGKFAQPEWYFGNSLPRVHVPLSISPISVVKQIIYHPVKRHLARAWVRLLQKRGLIVIGITGTAGKTTLKEMLLAVLSEKFNVIASRENIDPVFNIPATILRCNFKNQILILEMGIEYPGEMDFYKYLVQPDIAVITSLDKAHGEFLGTVKEIAEEKLRIFSGSHSLKIVNGLDPGIQKNVIPNMYDDTPAVIPDKPGMTGRKTLEEQSNRFSLDCDDCHWVGTKELQLLVATIDFGGTTIQYKNISSREQIKISLIGEHFAPLVLISIYIATHLDLSFPEIQHGLAKLKPVTHRLNIINNQSSLIIIDDTYNANPLAMKAALKTATQLKHGRKLIAVLGEMKELGKSSSFEHTVIGEYAHSNKVDYLIAYTPEAKNYLIGFSKTDSSFIAENKTVAIQKINDLLKDHQQDYLVLVKGSRTLKMEEIVTDLEKI